MFSASRFSVPAAVPHAALGLLLAAAAAPPAAAQTREPPRLLGRPADTTAVGLVDSARTTAPVTHSAAPLPLATGPRLLGRPSDAAAEPGMSAGAVLPSSTEPPRLLGHTRAATIPAADAARIARRSQAERCGLANLPALGRDPLPGELACLYGGRGPGRFGLLSYLDVPVYQPRTPLPGTHVIGIPGLPAPAPGESYEGWEWRVLNTGYGPEVRRAYNGLELLDPVVASKIVRFERALAEAGIRARRRETFRTPERQAFIFQQGRSRPGPVATTTLTSWHCRMDAVGRPAGRAVDYDVPGSQLPRFHQIAQDVGLQGYGSDSNDPGHVYYVGSEWLTGTEVAVMRMMPRVPHVTLATARPTDEVHTAASLALLRQEGRAWAASPFHPVPHVEPARLSPSAIHAVYRGPPPAGPAPAQVRRRGRRR